MKIAIQLASLRLPFDKSLLTAAKLGAAGVEIDARKQLLPREMSRTAIRQVRKMLEDLNLRAAAVAFPTTRGYHVAENLDQRIDGTKAALKLAYELGASVVVNHVGLVPAQSEGPEWTRLVEALTDIGRYGQRVGALLCAETGSESGPDLKRLIDALPTGSIGVTFDPGNLVINDFDPLESLRVLGTNVLYVQATDAVRDLARRRGAEVQLGRGSVDYSSLLGLLEEQEYRGWFTLERHESPDVARELEQGVRFLKSF